VEASRGSKRKFSRGTAFDSPPANCIGPSLALRMTEACGDDESRFRNRKPPK
jgi:hypothetical protein